MAVRAGLGVEGAAVAGESEGSAGDDGVGGVEDGAAQGSGLCDDAGRRDKEREQEEAGAREFQHASNQHQQNSSVNRFHP